MKFKTFFAIFAVLLVVQSSHQSSPGKVTSKAIVVLVVQAGLKYADQVLDKALEILTRANKVVSDIKGLNDALALCTDDNLSCIIDFAKSAVEVFKQLALENEKLNKLIQTLEYLGKLVRVVKDSTKEIFLGAVSSVIG